MSSAVQKHNFVRAQSGSRASQPPRPRCGAEEEERKWLARELHDGVGQGLMALRLYLGMLAGESRRPEAGLKVQEALKLLDHTTEELRRIIARLSPRALDEMGLLGAIRKLASDLSHGAGLEAALELPREIALPREIEVAVYRSLQEALHNIAKHAQARNFLIRMERRRGLVRLTVEDDGVGVSGEPNWRERGFGLAGMRERIAALGGTMRLRSRKNGASLAIVLPHTPSSPKLRNLEKKALSERLQMSGRVRARSLPQMRAPAFVTTR